MGRIVRLAFLPVSVLAFWACGVLPSADLQSLPESRDPVVEAMWEDDIKPILDGRCVVCHGCYDAPCQLQLSSSDGVDRGASKEAVYVSDRLLAMQPTRLFIDAQTTEQWRTRDFFTVRDGAAQSLLARMLALGRAHPPVPDARLPEEIPLDINRRLACPTVDEFDGYAEANPLGGMPYGVAPLSAAEQSTLEQWAWDGAPIPVSQTGVPRKTYRTVRRWEAFLNGDSLREQLVARYLYEHLFLAHLYFDPWPQGPYFRIVRSRTPPGEPVDRIASVRPYDDPGVERPWYRLVPVRSTILHKTHIVYRLDDGRMRRLRQSFLESEWDVESLPSYEPEVASNPFVTFDAIPAGARYGFLLDDAHYFIMTFIRGPVCRGQVAVDVIQDRFFVTFVDPDVDLSVTHPRFLEEAKPMLNLPAAAESRLSLGNLWIRHNKEQLEYGELRERFYQEADPQGLGPSMDFIWDGDGHNPNAYLTVFRNFDNATVLKGFVGDVPKTAWMIDFPIFERIYYNLVAGFDVFGNVTHQVSTRLYMDHLRMQSENHFLALLPRDQREKIRASWYRGAEKQVSYFATDRMRSLKHGTRIRYRTRDPRRELVDKLIDRAGALAGPPDTLNRCQQRCDRPEATRTEKLVENALRTLAGSKGRSVAPLPDVTSLHVTHEKGDLLYSLVHDKSHANVAFMFGEDDHRLPAEDRLTVVRGPFGSYPNFVFEVSSGEIGAFVASLRKVTDEASLSRVADRWGVRRTSPRFWDTIDWLHLELRRSGRAEAGLYDLNRYENL